LVFAFVDGFFNLDFPILNAYPVVCFANGASNKVAIGYGVNFERVPTI
jgi:hypothetical protein